MADRNAIAQGHSRSSGRLSSEEKRLLQSSHSNRSEKVQTQNERQKQSRKTTFQTVANNQESQVLVIVVINMKPPILSYQTFVLETNHQLFIHQHFVVSNESKFQLPRSNTT